MLLSSPEGVDANACSGRFHATALHAACYRGHPEVARLLLAKGAEANNANDLGEPALDWTMHGVLRRSWIVCYSTVPEITWGKFLGTKGLWSVKAISGYEAA